MHGIIPADPQAAIFPADSSDIENRLAEFDVLSDSENRGWFSKLARNLWPQKTAAMLAFLTGRRERQCHRYASAAAQPMADFLAALLRSDDGGRVLDEITRGSKARWWRKYQFAVAAMPAIEHLRQLDLPLD